MTSKEFDKKLTEKKNAIWNVFNIILIILGISHILYSAARCSNNQETAKWNDGYCECGGHWEYEQAVGHQYTTSYIYKCDSCGRRIEVKDER